MFDFLNEHNKTGSKLRIADVQVVPVQSIKEITITGIISNDLE